MASLFQNEVHEKCSQFASLGNCDVDNMLINEMVSTLVRMPIRLCYQHTSSFNIVWHFLVMIIFTAARSDALDCCSTWRTYMLL